MNTDETWIAEQFGRANLGDARRSLRAQKLALNIIKAPGKGLAVQTGSQSQCKAAYRLLNCPAVTREQLMQPHFEQTRSSAIELPVTLFVQDTTELDWSSIQQAQGYGPIGDHRGQGLLTHSLLALQPQGQILGLAAQLSWARTPGVVRKTSEARTQRYARADKESAVWYQALEAVGQVPEGKRWVSIGDRGSDSFLYWAKAREWGWQCLSRVFIDRCTSEEKKLLTKARELTVQGEWSVHQRARPGQAQRTLELKLAWQAVQILPAKNDGAQKKLELIDATVLRCWDEKHGVEWLLVATWPITDLDAARECVQWYQRRWTIEEFHKCLKSGCGIEKSQLKTATATQALLGFCSVVAVRLLALSRAARIMPEELASKYIDKSYLKVLCRLRSLAEETLSVGSYWREVAGLGGFLGRKGDGDPGWQTLWKGLTKLDDLVAGYLLAMAMKCG